MSTLGKIGAAAGILGAYTALPVVIGGTAYHFAFKRSGLQTSGHISKAVKDVKKRKSGAKPAAREGDIYHDAVMWFISSDRENVFLDSAVDGKKIHAYVLRRQKKTDKWVIIMHGLNGNPFDMALIAREYYGRGYNVLTPSMRGHALSSDDRVSMGYMDAKDVPQWAEFITAECPEAKIVLHGVSMGAAAVMMAAGEELPENVRCIVEDCGFARCNEQVVDSAAKVIGGSAKTLGLLVNGFMKAVRDYDLTDINPINCVRRSKLPILFVHGADDKVVPVENCRELYDACPTEKDILILPGAGHMTSSSKAHDEYFDRVFEFADKIFNS